MENNVIGTPTTNVTATATTNATSMPDIGTLEKIEDQKEKFRNELFSLWPSIEDMVQKDVEAGYLPQKAYLYAKREEIILCYADKVVGKLVTKMATQWVVDVMQKLKWSLAKNEPTRAIFSYDILAKEEEALAAKNNEQ